MKLSKSQLAWIFYDFANSAFHLMIPTILFPLYFRKVIAVGFEAPDLLWSIVATIPILTMGLISPALGAIADYTKKRKSFLVVSLSTTILLTLILASTSPDSLIWSSLIFIGAMLAFYASLFLYDAFLPLQTGGGKGTAFLSGLGWGIGYLGGLLCMALLYPLIKDAELPSAARAFQLSFLIIAGYYLLFSLPTIIYLKEPYTNNKQSTNLSEAIRGGLRQVILTVRNWRDYKEIFKFLLGFYFVNDGLTTVVFFTSIFAAETVKMTVNEILFAFIVVQIVGVPTTILVGTLAERLGYKRVLYWTVFLWIFIVTGFYFAQTKEHFYLLSIATGTVIGSTPATARALLAKMVKREKAGEIFGFNALSSRASSVIGPILFGTISTVTGSQRIAILSLIPFFGFGLWVLSLVRVQQD
jgi:MFS transporter, UMF1 family